MTGFEHQYSGLELIAMSAVLTHAAPPECHYKFTSTFDKKLVCLFEKGKA